jgi:hypothetical protein
VKTARLASSNVDRFQTTNSVLRLTYSHRKRGCRTATRPRLRFARAPPRATPPNSRTPTQTLRICFVSSEPPWDYCRDQRLSSKRSILRYRWPLGSTSVDPRPKLSQRARSGRFRQQTFVYLRSRRMLVCRARATCTKGTQYGLPEAFGATARSDAPSAQHQAPSTMRLAPSTKHLAPFLKEAEWHCGS